LVEVSLEGPSKGFLVMLLQAGTGAWGRELQSVLTGRRNVMHVALSTESAAIAMPLLVVVAIPSNDSALSVPRSMDLRVARRMGS
jgi:hypothetical protein